MSDPTRPSGPDPEAPPPTGGGPHSPAAEPALPTAAAMAGHVLGALGRVAAAVAAGDEVAADEARKAYRLAICNGCEHFRHVDQRCSICGCYARFKVAIIQEKCPIDKW